MKDDWRTLPLADDAELLRKEWFTYRVGGEWFDIELFEGTTGQFYAIGTPADKGRAVVYGSRVVESARQALAQTIRKIDRDHFGHAIARVGEDNEEPSTDTESGNGDEHG